LATKNKYSRVANNENDDDVDYDALI
jgi:hypothetical protein